MTENRVPGKEKPRNRKGYGGFSVMRKMGLEPTLKGSKAARGAGSQNLGRLLGHTFSDGAEMMPLKCVKSSFAYRSS